MLSRRSSLLILCLVGASHYFVAAQTDSSAPEKAILTGLRGLRGVPDAQRPAATTQLAMEIRSLPAGKKKVQLADGLSSLATEGDAGKTTLDAVAQTLYVSLAETPPAAEKGEAVPQPYVELAKLVKYEHVRVKDDPKAPIETMLATAMKVLSAQDAEIQKVDFTLTDLRDKPVTLSELKGKVVLVNFWATWCPPCRKEMPDLDAISKKYSGQGLVILSISDEPMAQVAPFIEKTGYSPRVLLDPGRTVNNLYHVDGIPKSFVYDRDGKMVAQTIDMRTAGQFMALLEQAGLKTDGQ